MLLLISFDGWNVGLGSLTADITLFIWIFVCQIAMAMIWYDDARCCIDMMIRYYDSWHSLQYWIQHTWDTEILQSNGPTIVSYKWTPIIVVEVLYKHHMIITFFHIPAPGMGSLLRVFLEMRLEKGNGARHLLGRGPKAKKCWFFCAFLCFSGAPEHKKNKKTQSMPQKKQKNTIHTTKKAQKKHNSYHKKNTQKKNIHTTKKSTKQIKKHNSYHKKTQKTHNSYHKKTHKKHTIHTKKSTNKNHNSYHKKTHEKKHNSYHKKAQKQTQFIPQKNKKNTIHTTKKAQKNTIHTTKKTQKETQFIPQKNKKQFIPQKKHKKHTIHTTENAQKNTIHTTKKHNSYHKKSTKKTKSFSFFSASVSVFFVLFFVFFSFFLCLLCFWKVAAFKAFSISQPGPAPAPPSASQPGL